MHKLVAIPTAIAMSIGLAACSSQPNQNLETARSEFASLQSNPLSQKYAALETQDASKQLDEANKAYLSDADEERVDQLASGVEIDRIQTVGYGEAYPVASNDSPASRAMNRRVEVTISNDNKRVAPRSSMQQ